LNSLCIIPCGKRKIWDKFPDIGPTAAREVYSGPFAKKCKEYAEKFHPDSWIILSAKHGFLFPDDIVPGPYEVTFNKKSTNPVRINDLIKQAKEKEISGYQRFIVLGGKQYAAIACQVFAGKTVEAPVSGLSGLDEIMRRIKIATESNQSLTDQLLNNKVRSLCSIQPRRSK